MPNKRKQYLWIPYLSDLKITPKTVEFNYKGGSLLIEWTKIHSIMLYGETVDLSQKFLEKCAFYKIPLIIHRRNLSRAVFVTPTLASDQNQLLSKQILYRQNRKKRAYIAKRLLQAKFKSCNWLFPVKRDLLYRVTRIEDMLGIESWHAREYWQLYYQRLKLSDASRRKKDNCLTASLDAVSKFVSGVFLRWILYHNLNPFYGFLHQPTDYPALVYDLFEPYRGYFDQVVFKTLKNLDLTKVKKSYAIGLAIEAVKKMFDKQIYVHATRQIVSFHQLIHGIVLALRAYLLGESPRFVVPLPSRPNGGRPIKAGYVLYGHKAGVTDFWTRARNLLIEKVI